MADFVQRRTEMGLTQRALATKAGVSLMTISRIETSKELFKSISIGNLYKIAEALEVSPEYCLTLMASVEPRGKTGNPNFVKGAPKPYESHPWKTKRERELKGEA